MTKIESTKKYTQDEFENKLSEMLKSRTITLKDVPKHLRENVARKAWGKYPLKSFADLEVIIK